MTRYPTSPAVKTRIRRAFAVHLGRSAGTGVLGAMGKLDRAYEMRCLVEVLRRLKRARRARTFLLISSQSPTFRQKGGPLRRTRFPFIEVWDSGICAAEIWTNLECTALSAWRDPHGPRTPTHPPRGDAHELDIVILEPGVAEGSYPTPDQIHLGVEAKCRPYSKSLLKELLGVRRETAYVVDPALFPGLHHSWSWWGTPIAASPQVALVAFCNNMTINNFQQPMSFYGIWMKYLK